MFPKSSWNGDHRHLVAPASRNGHVREMRENLYKNGESFHSDWKWPMRSEGKESHHGSGDFENVAQCENNCFAASI